MLLKDKRNNPPLRYGFAIVATLLSLPLAEVLKRHTDADPLFLSMAVAACVAMFAGFVPGLIAAVTSILGIAYFYLSPANGVPFESPAHVYQLGIFVVFALGISWFAGWIRERLMYNERMKNRVEFLYKSTNALFAGDVTFARKIEILSRIAIPQFADDCIIELVQKDGSIKRIAATINDLRNQTPNPKSRLSISWVVKTGVPILVKKISSETIKDIAGNEEHLRLLLALKIQSYIGAPIWIGDRCVGAIAFIVKKPRPPYTLDDLAIAEELSYRAAAAIENANLYTDLAQAVRARDDLMAIVSHDLKNPLSAVKLNASLLERTKDPDRITQAIKGIKRALDRAERLIHNLLDLSTIEAGGFRVEKKSCDVVDIFNDIIDIFRPLAAEKNISVEKNIEFKSHMIDCDRDRILQVFSNLVDNAIKFTPQNGTIRLAAHLTPEREILYSVSDNGTGLLPEQLPHIFDRFWQARKTAKQGTGLGLSIVKGIIEAHHGKIWVESKLGRGTTFYFKLDSVARDRVLENVG